MTGKEFAVKRRLMGFSRKQLGQAMQTSHRNIENWELGTYPVPGMAERLLELLERQYRLGTSLLREASGNGAQGKLP